MQEYEKRGYLLENFRLFHLRSQGTTKVDFHYHEFCKLLLLVSGQGSYYIDGQHYLLRPGDIITVGSHSIHKPEMEESSAYERIIIYVSPDWLQQVSDEECDLLSLFSGHHGHVLRLGEQKKKQLFRLADALERELSQEGFGRKLLCDTCLIRLLVELGRSRNQHDETQPSPVMPQSRRNFEIMQYLDRHLTEEIDIDRLAEQFYVSKFYMMHSFRRETGATIHMYLTHKRLLLAQQLIASGMSATESCYASGFRSYSAFTRAYGKHFGTTPTGRNGSSLMREEGFE
jgi:AraC-like DNA-binding protein